MAFGSWLRKIYDDKLSFLTPDFISEIFAGADGFRRLRVDVGEAGFFEGSQYRIDYEFSLASNETIVLKFETNGDTLLTSSLLDIDEGDVYYRVFANGVEGGTFGDTIDIWPANLMSDVTAVPSRVSITTGGTLDVTGEKANTIVRLRTSNANAQRETVTGTVNDLRGFPSTTAYIVMTTLDGQGDATGTLKLRWEER